MNIFGVQVKRSKPLSASISELRSREEEVIKKQLEQKEDLARSLIEDFDSPMEKSIFQALFGPGALDIAGQGDEDYLIQLTGGRQRIFPTDSVDDDLIRIYKILCWVYIAVKTISTTIARVPLLVVDQNTREHLNSHPFQAVIDNPSSDMTRNDLIERTFTYLDSDGKVLYKTIRDKRSGVPVGIDIPESYRIRPVIKDDQIVSFEIYLGETSHRKSRWEVLDIEDALYMRYFNPIDKFHGLSPISSVRLEVDTDIAANFWNRNFFKNSAVPIGGLATEQRLSQKEADRILAQFNNKYQGLLRSNKVAIFPFGLKWVDISLRHQDMEFLDQQRNVRAKIFAIYKVPLAVAGFYESESASGRSAGIQQYMESFWTLSLIPRMRKHVAALNKTYGEELGIAFEYDISEVEALQRNQLEQAQTAKAMMGTPLTLNEIRKMAYNMEPIDGLDVVLIPSTLLPIAELSSDTDLETEAWEDYSVVPATRENLSRILSVLERNTTKLLDSGGNGNGHKPSLSVQDLVKLSSGRVGSTCTPSLN